MATVTKSAQTQLPGDLRILEAFEPILLCLRGAHHFSLVRVIADFVPPGQRQTFSPPANWRRRHGMGIHFLGGVRTTIAYLVRTATKATRTRTIIICTTMEYRTSTNIPDDVTKPWSMKNIVDTCE